MLAAAHGAPIGNRKAKSAQAPADVEREIKLPEGTILTGAGEAEVRRAPPRACAAIGAVLLKLKGIGGRTARQVAVDEQVPTAVYLPDWFGMMLGPFSKVHPSVRCTCTLHACARCLHARPRRVRLCC